MKGYVPSHSSLFPDYEAVFVKFALLEVLFNQSFHVTKLFAWKQRWNQKDMMTLQATKRKEDEITDFGIITSD